MNPIEARALWDEHQRLLKAVDDLERRIVKLEAYVKAAREDSMRQAKLGALVRKEVAEQHRPEYGN